MKNFSTGNDGRAVTIYTAPKNVDSVDRSTRVTIAMTPLGGDARGDLARQVDIRLVPPGVVGGGLTAVPDFDHLARGPEAARNGDCSTRRTLRSTAKITAYAWDFGDGDRDSARSASHDYRDAGNYSVTLTVTDMHASTGSLSKSVQVEATDLP